MVARGASVNPWLVDDLLEGRDAGAPPSDGGGRRVEGLLGSAVDEMGPSRAPRWARKFLTWFLRPAGVPAARIEQLRRIERVDELLGRARRARRAGGSVRLREPDSLGASSPDAARDRCSCVLTPCFRLPL